MTKYTIWATALQIKLRLNQGGLTNSLWVEEILDKLAPLNQANLLANLSKSELIKYAKYSYYDYAKDAMVSGVMRSDCELSIKEVREDKALTRVQIIEKILQNKGRQEEKIADHKIISTEEFEKGLIESLEIIFVEYPKLEKSELIEKLERCDSKYLDELGLSYKKTDNKETLLKKILTYVLSTYTKERLIRFTKKEGVKVKSGDTKSQIIENLLTHWNVEE